MSALDEAVTATATHQTQEPPVVTPEAPTTPETHESDDSDESEEDGEDTQKHQNDPDLSDKETDTFEDAVDTGSVRSLTKRTASLSRPTPPDEKDESDYGEEEVSQPPTATHVPEMVEETPEEKLPRRISLASAASLDNVNLDDDVAAAAVTATATAAAAVATVVPTTVQKEKSSHHKEPSKSMSFSSITNALPAMPWSPPASDPSPKTSPGFAATAAAATPLAPPPTGRKLTSPFSWLSRSSSKDHTSSPPVVVSARRNTASSVATVTSNPDTILGKLDEEGEANGAPTAPRNTLKDRFQQLRMRDEAGVPTTTGEDEKTGGGALGILTENKESLAVQPPVSPIPPSPSRSLAPGTASGTTTAISDAPVDWDLWQSVVYEGPAAVSRTSPDELNQAIATGIPSAIRGVVWQVLAQSKNEELEVVYRDLVVRGTDKDKQINGSVITSSINGSVNNKEPASSSSSVTSDHSVTNGNGAPSPTDKDSDLFLRSQAAAAAERKKKDKEDLAMLKKLEKVIRRDLGARTSYSKFAVAQGLQEGLFGVCKAYALFDEGVGYAQGMNFLVMPLLFNMPEEEAFCLLVRLMNQYHLRDLFIQDMPGLHKHLYQFERLLEDLEPALYCHLHRRGISSHLYATQWFLTLFAYRFPLQLVLRIYDLIFSEGLSAILKFGIVLMQKNAAALLAMSDMAQLTTFLKDRLFDVYIDASPSSNSILESGFFGSSSSNIDKEVYRADQLVRDACEVKITPEALKLYAAEWEEKTRAEKEREAELEGLKAANASYAIKVRRLEEGIETVDREQAALATELVRTKVENEELKDENESLKGQVRELRVVIDQQPAELETKWQQERDDLVKRNENVHQENLRLEKELSELEEELVRTKMQFAEINSQHETLTRKWTDLKRQFSDG
ncbi:rab-GTPase-TBC domain-containing protein [Podospora appendiculata]|uniref:GTPase-activating protein GYP5 n=1 Tax=Podospora appendiculata TaxID=314037 RepID=A0AAE1C956_9PEZI|nr:rab-GTPase-TBC domain-containing protein [Podospora appendiculata]